MPITWGTDRYNLQCSQSLHYTLDSSRHNEHILKTWGDDHNIIFFELFMSFSMISWLVTITVTMSSDVIDVWQCDHNVTLTLTLAPNKEKKRKKGN